MDVQLASIDTGKAIGLSPPRSSSRESVRPSGAHLAPYSLQGLGAFSPGSRLRLSIAGTDADHFARVPHGRPPKLVVTLGGAHASFIELPIK
jgi:hypothetical protein